MPRKDPYHEDDLRFRRNEKQPKPRMLAVVFLAMDQSGSMSAQRIMIARAVCQYFLRWLRAKREHKGIVVVFIKQEGISEVVSEDKFFTRTGSGGTKFSTAYELTDELIEKDFSPKRYNIYGIHFTDGENDNGDNDAAESALTLLLSKMNLFGYFQFQKSQHSNETLSRFERLATRHSNLKILFAGKTSEIRSALEEFLREE